MSGRLHLALLRAASLVVCAAERDEWFAEWGAELCYVTPRCRTAFCLGAFRDAFWMRRHAAAPVHLQSPWECLALLTVLAALSVFFALRLPLPREMFFSRSLPDGLVTVSGIPLEDYRQFPADQANVAFFGRAHRCEGTLPVALASRNLFDLLHIPLATPADPSAAPLVLTLTAWRRNFAGDPHMVGRRMTVAGRPAQVAAVISGRVWRLPGDAEAWLLVDDLSLSAESRGYAVARLSPPARSVSVPHADGRVARFTCIPLGEPAPLFSFLLLMATAGMVLPAVTKMSLGEYPPNRHAPAIGMRRWVFLGAKIALLLPIILFGSTDVFSLFAIALQPHAMIVGSVLGFRWILIDQRRRCPVCLRVLTNPTPIGEPSRTLLEWYGTELVCTRGHGLLHVPEVRNSYSEQRWLHLDSSWSSLF